MISILENYLLSDDSTKEVDALVEQNDALHQKIELLQNKVSQIDSH